MQQQLPQPKPKRVPLGQEIEWTDADLDQLAEVKPADVKHALALWRNDAPTGFKDLLQAEVMEPDTNR